MRIVSLVSDQFQPLQDILIVMLWEHLPDRLRLDLRRFLSALECSLYWEVDYTEQCKKDTANHSQGSGNATTAETGTYIRQHWGGNNSYRY